MSICSFQSVYAGLRSSEYILFFTSDQFHKTSPFSETISKLPGSAFTVVLGAAIPHVDSGISCLEHELTVATEANREYARHRRGKLVWEHSCEISQSYTTRYKRP